MADFLLELFSEEIPARMQVAAIEHLQAALEAGLKAKASAVFSTPRRLAVIINDLPAMQADISTELKGPKIDAPDAALQGFLKKNNLTVEQLEKRDGVYFASIHQKGKATAEVLKELVEQTLQTFPWPKSMRWGSGAQTWVRPLHSILCIFDGKIVPVEFAGVKAGNQTRGHRFLAPALITISKPADYEAAMEKAFVVANRDKRKASILEQANTAAAGKKTALKSDIGLLEEVTGLVEYPVVLVGTIDDKFMDLPPEVLTTVMRSHQKYFALQNADGTLSPHFIITANTKAADSQAIISGNERVLRARFADARFFWDGDRNKKLSDWAEGLKTVTYHAKLGSIADKVSRITALADKLCDITKADKKLVAKAAQLCKADLVTGMVGEFAELQGVMGRYYAQQQKEDAAVADAIRDHYKPQGPGDSVPNAPVSVTIALADKLDTLVEMFRIGEKPTGSKDPFALRRAALGIIRIVLENKLRLRLKSLMNDELYAFFIDRLKVQLKDDGIRHDVINAVIADGDDDLVRIVARAKALQEFIATDDGKNLLIAYRRGVNILAIEEKKDGRQYNYTKGFPQIALANGDITFKASDEENKLGDAYVEIVPEIQNAIKNEIFVEAMSSAAKLRVPVDAFFANVQINVDDKTLRENRLQMLTMLRTSFNWIADFSKIEG